MNLLDRKQQEEFFYDYLSEGAAAKAWYPRRGVKL